MTLPVMRKVRKEREGVVVSNKPAKTVVVVVHRKVKHPLYPRFMQKSSRLMAHDSQGLCQEGDRVLVQETRPWSKRKRWRLVRVIETKK